jgi:hypothetical protein
VFVNGSGWGDQPWQEPAQAQEPDGLYAWVELDALLAPDSYPLECTGFGFDIPAEAHVLGVEARLLARGSQVDGIKDSLRLVVGGTRSGDTKAHVHTWPTVDTWMQAGGEDDLWGHYQGLSPSEVNASDFGVAVFAHGQADMVTAYLDAVELTVYYAIPEHLYGQDEAAGAEQAQVLLGGSDSAQGTDGTTFQDKEFSAQDEAQGSERGELPASTGAALPGTATNYVISTADCRWCDTERVLEKSSDTSSASQPLNKTADCADIVRNLPIQTHTDYLYASGFGFNVPPGAEILGIEARALVACDNARAKDYSVKLFVGGSPQGQDKATDDVWPSDRNNPGEKTWGGTTDTWGLNLKGEDVRASDFGFGISVQNFTDSGAEDAYLFWMELTVYYRSTAEGSDGAVLSETASLSAQVPASDATHASDASTRLQDDTGAELLFAGQALRAQEAAGLSATDSASEVLNLQETGRAFRYGQPLQRLRALPRYEPLYLVKISLSGGAHVLYLSDRNIRVGDELYEDYLDDLEGVAEELRRAALESRNAEVTLRFRNDRYRGHQHLVELSEQYPFEGAQVEIYETALDARGRPAPPELLFRGTLEEPTGIDRLRFSCRVSSAEFAASLRWSMPVVSSDDYPDAHEDTGRVVPIVYGSDLLVPALKVDWGARSTLAADLPEGAAELELTDAERFPPSGHVWIDEEKLYYSAREGSRLKGLKRGRDGTRAAPHKAGAEVLEHQEERISLLAAHPLEVKQIYGLYQGRLVRVQEGVEPYVGPDGRQYLRSSRHLRLQEVEDQVEVEDTIGVRHTDDGLVKGTETVYQMAKETYDVRLENDNGFKAVVASFNPVEGFQRAEYSIKFNTYILWGSGSLSDSYVEIRARAKGAPLADAEMVFRADGNGIQAYDPKFTQRYNSNQVEFLVYEAYNLWFVDVEITSASRSVHREATFQGKGAAEKTGQAKKLGQVVATSRPVERLYALVSGAKDEQGQVLARPDEVVRHFLLNWAGFSEAEIDQESFSEAGAFYAQEGYSFGFALAEGKGLLEILRGLALQCRSSLRYERGRWVLRVLPSQAPEPVKTISHEELAGQGAQFVFHRSPWTEVKNSLTARFRQNYAPLQGASEWDGTVKAEDSLSISKYGRLPEELTFWAIRDEAMAREVLAHLLQERSRARLRVEFSVLWEHLDLQVGDTLQIDNPLFGGKRFFVEAIRRGKGMALVRASEWWQ